MYTEWVTVTSIPFSRLAPINRRPMVLRAVSVEFLDDDDHSARSIWELVGCLELSPMLSEERSDLIESPVFKVGGDLQGPVDAGESAKSLNRPGMTRLLDLWIPVRRRTRPGQRRRARLTAIL